MRDEFALKIINRDGELNTHRQNFETVWEEISEFVVPNRGDFQSKRAQAERKDRRVFDSTAVHSNEMLASALHTGLTNPSSRWFTLSPIDVELLEDDDINAYIESALKKMYAVLNSPVTGFYQHNHEFLLEIGSYGTSIMFVDEDPVTTARFRNIHLSQCKIQEGANGEVDTVHRCFKLTARQAAQQFGEEACADFYSKIGHQMDKELEFIHAVMPKKDFIALGGDEKEVSGKKAFGSVYVCKEYNKVVSQSGYYEMPYIVARWTKVVGEMYGRSPAWNALSDIRMVNVMSETIIRAAQKQVDPPMLMADDGVLMPLHTYPSGVNIGGLSEDGTPLIQPLISGGNINLGEVMLEQRRDAIRKAFFVDQFAPSEGTPASATERIQLEQTGLRLTGPHLNRLQVEYLNRILDRLFGMLDRAGKLGKAPVTLQGKELRVSYVSPLANNQRAPELQALNIAIGSVGPLVELDPDILDYVDGDSLFKDNMIIAGVPRDKIRSKEKVSSIRSARNKVVAEQQQMAQAQQMAQTAATLQKSGIPVT